MTVSSPILATSVQPSVPEKRPLLADLLTKVVPSPHSSSAISLSSQQVREQLTQMLNNKSLHPMKAFSKVGVVASTKVATTAAATGTVLPNRTFQQLDSILHCKTSVNPRPGLVQICLAKNYVTSATSSQLPNSVVRPAMGTAMLGKRTLNSEDGSNSRPVKKSLIACKEILSRSVDNSYSAKSDSSSNPKSESAASLMPVLASALLTNDNVSSTASLSSCIPTVVLMQKPGMASHSLTSSKSQVVNLSHILRSDSVKPTVQKEMSVSMSTSSKGAACLREELASKCDAQSNRIKKNLFMSEDSSPKRQENFHKHIEKLAVLISEKERGEQGKAAVGNQVILSSSSPSASSSMLSSSLLNSLIMSNASFLSAAPGPNSISSIVMTPSFLQQQQRLAVPSVSRDAFQVQDTSINAASAAPKCVLPFLASQGETVYIVQQASSSPAVAKPLPPAIAFPNQAPLILVLANPSLPGMALASSQLPQASHAAGAPKLAINTQPLELAFGNQSGSAAPVVVTQASQTMIPSQTLVVGNKTVVNHAFQTFTFASQAQQSFTGTSQTAKTLVVGSTPAVTFSNRASLSCGGNMATRTFTVLNHGFQKLESGCPAGMVETTTPRQPTSTNVGLSARPMFIGNQASERFVLANLSANQTSQMLNMANTHLKDNVGTTSLATYNPPLDNQAVANQLPQLLVAISGASPQILCAAKNSVGSIPVIGQLSFKAVSTPPKIGPGSICMLRRPSPTENLQASPVPSVRCCNILPSPGGVPSASAPIILLQAPLSKATAPPSETLVSLAIPASVSSFSSAPRSSLITAPSQQQPLMFQMLPDNNVHHVDPQNPQKIILNTMPLNGGLELKMQLDGSEKTNVDILRSCCNASTISESICTPVAENQVLSKSTHLLNGSRVKTITIKKLTPPVGHAASSTVTGQSSSLIKTLLTNREPDQVLFLSSDNHDILNSMFRVGQNACVVGDSTREMRQDGAGVDICKSCGSVLDRNSSGEAWNSVGVCVACHSSV